MKAGLILLILFMLLLSGACQVQEKTPSSGLIAGHLPTENKFTLSAPTSKTYVAGENLTIHLSFPYNVTVTGTPQLGLVVGSTSRAANYVSGNGSKVLTFSYPIVAADNDTDGVSLTGLSLNGGTLTFTNNNTISNCDITTVSAQSFSGVLVDNTAPAISSFTLISAPNFYNVGETINFTVVYSEPVVVTGTPKINFTFNGAGSAVYSGGSGSTTLSFRYTVASDRFDLDGYAFADADLSIKEGTIADSSGNAAARVLPNTATVTNDSLTRPFDGRVPYIVNITPPAAGTYSTAQNLDFKVEFDKAVTVTGNPYLQLTIGSQTKQAFITSGSGTKTLTFRYTTVPGDSDTDGITVTNSIQELDPSDEIASNGYSYFVTGNTLFNPPSTSSVLVRSVQPQPTSVVIQQDTSPKVFGTGAGLVDGYFIIGEQILVTVGFNDTMYVTQTNGTPRIAMTIGSTTRYANYYSGGDGQTSLVFRYVVQEGDLDTDGITLAGSIDLNGGTITNQPLTNSLLTLPTTSFTNRFVDGVRPTISSVTAPNDNTYSMTVGRQVMDFTLNWNEPITFTTMNFSFEAYAPATTINTTYVSGNETNAVLMRWTQTTTDNKEDLDGITINSNAVSSPQVTDAYGNTATDFTVNGIPNTSGVLLDTYPPRISTITPPASKTYMHGENIDFTVEFNESVVLTATGSYPRIRITVGGTTRYAVATGSGTGTTHTFRYTVTYRDLDTDGIAVFGSATTLSVGGGASIIDNGTNVFDGTVAAQTFAGINADGAPEITTVNQPAAGTYVDAGNGPLTQLTFTVNFSENVTVAGNPRIVLTIGSNTVYADYVSGSGSSSLVFTYNVQSSDLDLDGIAYASNLNLADTNQPNTIQDSALQNARVTFTGTTLTTRYVAPKIAVWKKAGSLINLSGMTGAPTLSGLGSNNVISGDTYEKYDGTQTLTASSAISAVNACYATLFTSLAGGDEYLLDNLVEIKASTDYYLQSLGNDFEILDTSISSSGTTGNLAFNQKSEFCLTTTLAIPTTDIVPLGFTNNVAEIILSETGLTVGQLSHIRSYLTGKY